MIADYNVFEHPTVVELLKDMTAAAFRSLGEPGDVIRKVPKVDYL